MKPVCAKLIQQSSKLSILCLGLYTKKIKQERTLNIIPNRYLVFILRFHVADFGSPAVAWDHLTSLNGSIGCSSNLAARYVSIVLNWKNHESTQMHFWRTEASRGTAYGVLAFLLQVHHKGWLRAEAQQKNLLKEVTLPGTLRNNLRP